MGYDFGLRIWVDSTAAKAIVSSIGLGRDRHMGVKFLCAQEAHKNSRFQVHKIAGDRNPSDVLTKPKSAADKSCFQNKNIGRETKLDLRCQVAL